MNRSLFWGGVLALSALSLGCGGLSSHGNCGGPDGGPDGGTGGGSGGGFGTGGGTSTGGGSATGGGSSTGGGSATGGGGSVGGGAGGGGGASNRPFVYSELAMPFTNGSYVNAIAGRPGETWAVTDFGKVMKKGADGGFAEVTGSWNGQLIDVWVGTNGEVAMISAGRSSFTCPGNCNTFADFTQLSVGDSSWGLNSICGNAFNDLYAIGDRDTASIATLAHFDGVTWTTLSQDLGMTDPHGCFMRPDGTMWIAGLKDVVRWDNGAATLETLDLDLSVLGSSASSQYWYDLAGFGDNIFAVGSDHRVIGRDSNGHWSLVSNPAQQQSSFYAVGAVSPTELYAGGYAYSSEAMWWKSDGGTWVASNPDLPFINYVKAIYVAGPNELYIGGDDGNFGPMILRATR